MKFLKNASILRFEASGQLWYFALHRIFAPEVSLSAFHLPSYIINTHVIFCATVTASEESLSCRAIRGIIDHSGLRDGLGNGSRNWRSGRRACLFLGIIISLSDALSLGRTLALIIQIIPVNSRCTLMLVRNAIRADVILLTVPGVSDKVQGVIAEATNWTFIRGRLKEKSYSFQPQITSVKKTYSWIVRFTLHFVFPIANL